MDESQVVDVWMLFKEYLDKKQIELAAERYIDLCADYGVSDIALKDALGNDAVLDSAINYYLDIDEETFADDDSWDDED
jgi:hypothetical protein